MDRKSSSVRPKNEFFKLTKLMCKLEKMVTNLLHNTSALHQSMRSKDQIPSALRAEERYTWVRGIRLALNETFCKVLVVFHRIDPPKNSQNFVEKAHYPDAGCNSTKNFYKNSFNPSLE